MGDHSSMLDDIEKRYGTTYMVELRESEPSLISDEDGLKKAIRLLIHGDSDHDLSRRDLMVRAKSLQKDELIPDNWASDGSLKDTKRAWNTKEERDTANDVMSGLESALHDALGDEECCGDCCCYWLWVMDWAGGNPDEPYVVIYQNHEDLLAAPFSFDDDGKITIDIEAAVKVRRITSYVERKKPAQTEKRTAAWAARERRKARAQLLDKTYERRHCVPGVELREIGDGLIKAVGCASVTERSYEVLDWEETVRGGAFKRTLAEKPDVVYLANHEGMPLARTTTDSLTLEEDWRGLQYDADLQDHDPDVIQLRPKLERGDMNESSFAFRVREQEWDADYRKRDLLDLGLHKGDVSVVNFGANDSTTAGIRALHGGDFEHLSGALRELRAGKALSGTNEEVLTRVLDLVAKADEDVDEAQPLLARVLGVANPDDDKPDEEDEPERGRVVVSSYAGIARAKRAALMGSVR
jgi:HK97 family phage prohead protease